jgi:Protein of unknown function (DUF1569)
MKSLADPVCRREIEGRLARLTPTDRAQWGKMSVHQMICHLGEAYRCALGQKQTSPAPFFVPPPLMRFIALRVPLKWPQGFPSPREVAQDRDGTPPVEFTQDHAELLAAFRDFCARPLQPCPMHPYFGRMSPADWNRWGYLHADHHLRQFAR